MGLSHLSGRSGTGYQSTLAGLRLGRQKGEGALGLLPGLHQNVVANDSGLEQENNTSIHYPHSFKIAVSARLAKIHALLRYKTP